MASLHVSSGLTAEEVRSRLLEFGPNELTAKKQKTRLQIFIHQFADTMVVVLVLAAGVSFAVGEHTDALVILAIILGNAILGYVQEYNAEQSLQKLKSLAPPLAAVMRDGVLQQLPSSELVPGDVIHLEAGNVVPADARLLEIHSLKTGEAALTGESFPVEKKLGKTDARAPLAERSDTIFKGTIISSGTAVAEVTATGMKTELGRIAAMLDAESPPTPLQKRLARFSRKLAVIVLFICATVFGLGLLRGEPPMQMFLTAVSLAVAALPEALPAVITIALARGAVCMAKQNALMRRLPAVETLGSVTYICSDKTGTLTQNKMKVEQVAAGEDFKDLLPVMMLLNNDVKKGKDAMLIGDATEVALMQYANAQGKDLQQAGLDFPLEEKLPFDSERMMMSTLHRAGDRWLIIVKGAPVKVVESLHSRHVAQKDQWLVQNREWAAQGMRVLFFAAKYLDEKPAEITIEVLERDLDFAGAVGMIDPPREAAADAVRECRTAGITPVMITGDQALTAKAIAQRIGILDESGGVVVTGAELQQLDKDKLRETVLHTRVYARVSPEQKLTIVKSLQDAGQFVAMTGDGVNDAPSLKQADIGIAMGITGTDVSKEAAGMILLDDNFATIVKAVREGRRIYANIRKFVQYVLSCNLGEILTLFIAPFLGLPLPLLPIHILWINLVTDGLPGIALVAEPGDKDLMCQPPRSPGESLFAGGMARNILLSGTVLAGAALAAQAWAKSTGYGNPAQQSLVLTVLCFAQLGNALSLRTGRHFLLHRFFANIPLLLSILLTVILQLLIIYVPVLNSIFKTSPLDLRALVAGVIFSTICIALLELVKLLPTGRGMS